MQFGGFSAEAGRSQGCQGFKSPPLFTTSSIFPVLSEYCTSQLYVHWVFFGTIAAEIRLIYVLPFCFTVPEADVWNPAKSAAEIL